MNIAIIGYGRMGKTIEAICQSRNHHISAIIDQDNSDELKNLTPDTVDVAIEFTQPESAFNNIKSLIHQDIPVVCGTTAWTEHLPEIRQLVEEKQGSFFYAPNYSIGVNLFFAINDYISKLMNSFDEFSVRMEEIHHIHKLDSPSGTALHLANTILANTDSKDSWVNDVSDKKNELEIVSKREVEVAGIHSVIYEGEFDTMTFTHDAKSRKGFALGAVLAAEWLHGKKGIYSMSDLLKEHLPAEV